MSQPPKPRGLGRGLSALLGDDEVAATVAPPPPSRKRPRRRRDPRPVRAPLTLPIGQLKAGRMQPRTTFEDMDALVDSVKEFGLLQPILVRPVAGQTEAYEIVAGERRWRAAQKAQLHEVPVVVRTMGDQDALQLGLVENLQRADLTPIDEALGYRRLSEDFKQTQEDIAKTVGKSRPHVANTLRLLELPGRGAGDDPPRRAHRRPGARPDRRARSAGRGAARGRREAVGARPRAPGRRRSSPRSRVDGPRRRAPLAKSADTKALEKRIEEALGLKADLKLRGLGEQSLADPGDPRLRSARHRGGAPDAPLKKRTLSPALQLGMTGAELPGR